jgi:hypothetical protein
MGLAHPPQRELGSVQTAVTPLTEATTMITTEVTTEVRMVTRTEVVTAATVDMDPAMALATDHLWAMATAMVAMATTEATEVMMNMINLEGWVRTDEDILTKAFLG